MVKDLEVVYVPTIERGGMFGQHEVDLLTDHLEREYPPSRRVKWGPRYKQIALGDDVCPYMKLDLFLAELETFGLIYALRTGPSEFSRRLVTPQSKNGLLLDGYVVDNGRLWRRMDPSSEHEQQILTTGERGRDWCWYDDQRYIFQPTPEEDDFFAATRLGKPPDPLAR